MVRDAEYFFFGFVYYSQMSRFIHPGIIHHDFAIRYLHVIVKIFVFRKHTHSVIIFLRISLLQ